MGLGVPTLPDLVELGEDKGEGELHPAIAGEGSWAMLETIETFLLSAEVLAPASFYKSGGADSELSRECLGSRIGRA